MSMAEQPTMQWEDAASASNHHLLILSSMSVVQTIVLILAL
jgi:hypothetical protein